MKHLLVMFAFILMTSFAFVAMPSTAWAADDGSKQEELGQKDSGSKDGVKFFRAATKKSADIFKNTKTVIYIVGAFGLMVIAVGAIFGKLAWRTLAYLAIGLLLLVGAGAIIDYFVADDNVILETGLNDTLWNV